MSECVHLRYRLWLLGSPFCSGQDSFAAAASPCFSFFLVFAFTPCSLVVKGGGVIELRSRGVYLMGESC